MEMISFTKLQVPPYLVGSDYFLGLNCEEEFTVARKYLKPDPTVDSCEKLHHLLETIHFWGLHKVPNDLLQFLFAEKMCVVEVQKICLILSHFDAEFPLLQAFQHFQVLNTPKERSEVTALLRFAFVREGALSRALVKYAAENGLDGLLQHLVADVLSMSDRPFTHVSLATVVRRGHIDCLRFLLTNKCRKEYGICAVAAEVGRIDCLKLFQEFDYALDESVMCGAAQHGHLSCLEYVYSHVNKITVQTAIAAAAGGYLECVKYVLSHDVPFTADALTSAARNGHVDILPLLQEHGGTVTADAVTAAASNGHVDCIQYLIAQGAALTNKATLSAATSGCIECLELLDAHECPRDAHCVTTAASAGDLRCLEYLLQAGYSIDDAATMAATTYRHIHCLAVLLQKLDQEKIPAECVDIAITDNNMECLQLLHDAGAPVHLKALHDSFRSPNYKKYLNTLMEVGYTFAPITAKAAIECRNIDCLKYLCEKKRVELTSDVCEYAAGLGVDLKYIQLLRHYNCPWDVTACASAARWNNLACLTYLHEQGCPWDDTTFAAILRNNVVGRDCLLYALEKDCPLGDSVNVCGVIRFMHSASLPVTIAITNAAAECGGVECLQYALANGAPAMDASTSAAAARYKPDDPTLSLVMLGYMLSLGCPWDERTATAAAAHPISTCLRYVHERGCPWSSRTVLAAVSNRSTQCLQYLLQHGCPCDEAMERAAAQPSSECLEVLHRAGCRWSVSVAYAAANAGSLACLQYARAHQCPWDATVSEAATQHPECLHYCVQEGCPIMYPTMEEYNRKFKI